MLLPVLLEGEPQSGVIWYEIFRQSPEAGLPAQLFPIEDPVDEQKVFARIDFSPTQP